MLIHIPTSNEELKKVGVITSRIFETLKMLLLTATTIARILVDAG